MAAALVIEDNQNNMKLISDILELNKYTVIQAETGMSGFHAADEKQPDFIILDIYLPDISGFNVLKKIRANTNTATIPVIAMTSYALTGDRAKFMAAGCDGYLEKPIDAAIVIQQIKQVIDK